MSDSVRATGAAIKHSRAQHVAGRDININVTLQLRAEDLRALLTVLGDHIAANALAHAEGRAAPRLTTRPTSP